MKNVTLITLVIFTLAIISFIGWWDMYSPSSPVSVPQQEKQAVTVSEPVAPVLEPIETSNGKQVKIAETQVKILPEIMNKQSVVKEEVEQALLREAEALYLVESLLDNMKNNLGIDFSAEKSLLNYLKKTDNESVYQLIIEKLKTVNTGNENDDRLMEYSLSLLAAIDSSRASEILFSFVGEDNWKGSHAIYTVRKSISKLTINGKYTDLVEETFAQAKDNNPYIQELATGIAQNAKTEQIDYLINYVDGESVNKSTVASQAMNKVHTESLVPHISSYISEKSTQKVQYTALNSLAHMGQYEAASSLITWSSKQQKESAKQVEALFNIALKRSPSTKRAIEKEIHFQEFKSEELKTLIISLSKKGL